MQGPPDIRLFGADRGGEVRGRREVAQGRGILHRHARACAAADVQPVHALVRVLLVHLCPAELLAKKIEPVIAVEDAVAVVCHVNGNRLSQAGKGKCVRVSVGETGIDAHQIVRRDHRDPISEDADAHPDGSGGRSRRIRTPRTCFGAVHGRGRQQAGQGQHQGQEQAQKRGGSSGRLSGRLGC